MVDGVCRQVGGVGGKRRGAKVVRRVYTTGRSYEGK